VLGVREKPEKKNLGKKQERIEEGVRENEIVLREAGRGPGRGKGRCEGQEKVDRGEHWLQS
jgi:hypothetical protein